MATLPPTRAQIAEIRARACPAGLLRVPVLPGYAGVPVGFVFAVGQVTVDGSRQNADELDLVIEACLRAGHLPDDHLAPYVQFVIARRIAAPDRLSGAAITTYLRELAR